MYFTMDNVYFKFDHIFFKSNEKCVDHLMYGHQVGIGNKLTLRHQLST